jgi:coatomer subunit beta'
VKKMMYKRPEDDEQRFQNELSCLMGLKHKNIVRLLGYCVEAQSEMEDFNGKMVLVEMRQMLLCFEYPRGGGLAAYITGTRIV